MPTGTVTLLFTDVEGSTQRWEQQPEEMKAALRHDALMRAAIEAHGATFLKPLALRSRRNAFRRASLLRGCYFLVVPRRLDAAFRRSTFRHHRKTEATGCYRRSKREARTANRHLRGRTSVAFAIVHFFPGGTKEQYDASIAAVHPGQGLPGGQIFHAAGPSPGGWTIFAVHETKESWERFRDGVLTPKVQQGIEGGFAGPPQETPIDVYKLMP